MKAALLLAAAGALGAAAPLAAQEAAAPAAAPQAPSQPAASPVTPTAPGPIVLVSGPYALLATLGTAPLSTEAQVCLGPDEVALLASDRVTFQLTGEACFTASVAEREAFEAEQGALEDEALGLATEESDASFASSDPSAIDERFETARTETPDESEDARAQKEAFAAAMRDRSNAQSERQRDSVREERERQAAMAERAMLNRTRAGAVLGSPTPPPRPIIFRLAGASPSVLGRYPRGTIVQRTTSLCLQNGEQATISGSHGQSVTYTGPGCLRRKARPTGDNLGGFTFG